MPYELRCPGRPAATFDTEPEAVAAAREILVEDPDAEVDVIDTATGKPAPPGASKGWREDLKKRVGF